jgi:integrase
VVDDEDMMAIIDFRQAARTRRATSSHQAEPCVLDLLTPWCAARHADGFEDSGVARYRDQIVAFVRWAGMAIRVKDLTEALFRSYKVDLGSRCAPGTTRNALTALRAFCEWCIVEGYLTMNPAQRVTHPRVTAPAPNPLTRAQIVVLLAAIDALPRSHSATWRRNRRAIALMLYAGLRRSEVAALLWGDIDLARREIIVRRGKGGKSRVVPICDELATELMLDGRYPDQYAVVGLEDGQPLAHDSIGHIFERWLVKRGIRISPHQLRRTFATELYRRGEDLFTIQRLLGHSDPKTTLRYIGASSEKEHSAVNKLRLRLPEDE